MLTLRNMGQQLSSPVQLTDDWSRDVDGAEARTPARILSGRFVSGRNSSGRFISYITQRRRYTVSYSGEISPVDLHTSKSLQDDFLDCAKKLEFF